MTKKFSVSGIVGCWWFVVCTGDVHVPVARMEYIFDRCCGKGSWCAGTAGDWAGSLDDGRKTHVENQLESGYKIAYCVAALLVLGTGMAMIMAMENLMIPGIIVGFVGIVLCLGIIPVFKGLK